MLSRYYLNSHEAAKRRLFSAGVLVVTSQALSNPSRIEGVLLQQIKILKPSRVKIAVVYCKFH